jgi:hypothetical protein
MRNISAENQTALEANLLVPRDFIWFIAKDRESGEEEARGFWSDLEPVNAEVMNPDTGLAEARDFIGAGGLISIADIPSIAAVQVQTIQVKMSHLEDAVNEVVRLYDIRQGRVEIYRGLFHAGGRVMVAPAECRFVGFVDRVDITTPKEGEDGGVVVSCVSHTREMTRANPDTRSHENQLVRHPGDNFFIDAAKAGEEEYFWGKSKGKIDTKNSNGGGGRWWDSAGPVNDAAPPPPDFGRF